MIRLEYGVYHQQLVTRVYEIERIQKSLNANTYRHAKCLLQYTNMFSPDIFSLSPITPQHIEAPFSISCYMLQITALDVSCHGKIRIVIAYIYGIMMIERFRLLDPAPIARQILSLMVALFSILLLVLLRRLSGLVLELLDRLLRVVLVTAVGLDLCHKLALAKCTTSFRPCVRAHGSHTPGRRIQTYRALAIASKTLVPFSLAVLLLLQLLLLELLSLFGCARVCIEVEVSTGSSS